MVNFSKIARLICHNIYLSNPNLDQMVVLTDDIEKELEGWVEGLPPVIRPPIQTQHYQPSLKSVKDAQWAKRQRLVLSIRYYNLRSLLFGSLLLRSSPNERASIPGCQDNVKKCLDSAKQTISIIYETYAHNVFFQTWYVGLNRPGIASFVAYLIVRFYNTKYAVFAASVILLHITQGSAGNEEVESLFRFVNMAVEILEIMDECDVALEAAKFLRLAKEKAEIRLSPQSAATYEEDLMNHENSPLHTNTSLFKNAEGQVQWNQYWGPLGLMDSSGMDLDIATQLGASNQNNPMFLSLDDQ